ncbi:MAG: glycosyltransferase family 4 protein, partial [Bacilli bacterium]|nr:glycosyltransferase family 4 protein [Bacilli bacterium]
MVCQFYYPENFIITKVAEQMAADGNEVHVLTGKPNYGYGYILPAYKHISEEVINGVNVHRVNLYPRKQSRLSIIRNYLSFWRNSKKWVRKTKLHFDYVYSMSLSPVTICCAGNLYAKKHHVKHIIHCLDLWPESVLVTNAVKEKSILYRVLYRWSRSIYFKADKILISSPSFRQYFKKTLKLPTNNIKYVPQCSLVEDSDIAAFDYGKGTHILYCGNLGLIQQIPLIIEAMELLKDKDIYFHIIGMGPMSDYLINQIKERRLDNHVIYHGP